MAAPRSSRSSGGSSRSSRPGGARHQGGRPSGAAQAGAQRRGQGRERGKGNAGGKHHRAQRRSFRCDPARRASLEALTKVHRDDAYANLILPDIITSYGLDRRDAAFTTALTYGALRLQGRYDAILERCVDRPLATLDQVVLDVLRLGTHQLLGMRVATHAAVSASVDLATDAASRGAAGLVNAVLRKVAAHSEAEWLAILTGNQPTNQGETVDQASSGVGNDGMPDADRLLPAVLATAHAHPEWIVRALRHALEFHGRPGSEIEALLEADNAEPQVTLCARPGLVSPEHLAKEAERLGADPARGDLSPYAVILDHGDPGRLESVRSARAGVEDEGSQLVALLATEVPLEGRDERWLDMCAGPGGKAALLGARAAQRGAHLVANEVSPHRTGLVRSSVKALSTGRNGTVEVRCSDGRRWGTDKPGFFDRVLVDAPCSGLGSLRRRPEARWRRQAADVADLTATQRDLLASALRAVRVGGVVAYVTCSPHVAETALVVKDVRRAMEKDGIATDLIHAGDVATRVAPMPPAGAAGEMLQLWPHLDGTDAMFCALLRRTA